MRFKGRDIQITSAHKWQARAYPEHDRRSSRLVGGRNKWAGSSRGEPFGT